MNMARGGGTMTYEDDALYDALDEAGVLLWHDLMCANMDYPDELATQLSAEVGEEFARLQARPCVAVICGNSEGSQQAAMFGAPRERWNPALFDEVLRHAVSLRLPDAHYVPSSTSAGAFPHASNAGPASYYGVGAYLRPLEDAPRDLGAGWDFDDVRDHYVKLLYGVEPASLRYADHDRYLALGRAATAEVMARTFSEWRRARAVTGGGLIWFLRDLWPGAGWGVIDAHGQPRSCYFALRRALA